MKFILRIKESYGEYIRGEVEEFLHSNGCETTRELEKGCDFALNLGGDGTLLRDQTHIDCPVLGINPGKSIGYYLRADEKDYREKLMKLMKGRKGKDYHVHELMRIRAELNGKPVEALALNDILISPIYVRRMLKAEMDVRNKKTTERNSGIIVYTPTGSHAFAHSAGAKRIRYDCGKMGIAAFAPYSGVLKKREILTDKGPVRIECMSEEGELCIDGSEVNITKLRKGDVVSIEKSSSPLRIVSFDKRFD